MSIILVCSNKNNQIETQTNWHKPLDKYLSTKNMSVAYIWFLKNIWWLLIYRNSLWFFRMVIISRLAKVMVYWHFNFHVMIKRFVETSGFYKIKIYITIKAYLKHKSIFMLWLNNLRKRLGFIRAKYIYLSIKAYLKHKCIRFHWSF